MILILSKIHDDHFKNVTANVNKAFFDWDEVLRPSQPIRVMSSAISLPNHIFQPSKPLTSITSTCADSFTRNWQPWIRRKGENDRRKYFMMNHIVRMLLDLAEIQPAPSWSPVRCVCDCATKADVNKVTFVDLACDCWQRKMMADGQCVITIAHPEHLLLRSKYLSTFLTENKKVPYLELCSYVFFKYTQSTLFIWHSIQWQNSLQL